MIYHLKYKINAMRGPIGAKGHTQHDNPFSNNVKRFSILRVETQKATLIPKGYPKPT